MNKLLYTIISRQTRIPSGGDMMQVPSKITGKPNNYKYIYIYVFFFFLNRKPNNYNCTFHLTSQIQLKYSFTSIDIIAPIHFLWKQNYN